MFYQEIPYVNYVQQDAELAKQGVELILSQNSQIESYNALVWGNKVLVGVISHPLYSRTQRQALEAQIISDINDVYGFEEVLVSFDTDIFYEISKINKNSDANDTDISKLFYCVKVRRV